MKAFTLEAPGRLVRGITLTAGAIHVGTNPATGRPLTVPIDPCAEVEGDRFVGAPGRGAMLLLRDHAPPNGAWRLRDPWTDATWDAVVAEELAAWLANTLGIERPGAEPPRDVPTRRWFEFARAVVAPRNLATVLYGYLEEGGAVELVRTGDEDDDTTRVFRVACEGAAVTVRDPRADARGRKPVPT